jgi:hypothetical protein
LFEFHVDMISEVQMNNVTKIAQKKKSDPDRAEVLGLLQRAMDHQPSAGRSPRPAFNPRALLVVADRLDGNVLCNGPDRSGLAAAMRALADTPFFETPGHEGADWQPVACGPDWNVAVKGVYPGPYQVRRQLYDGANQRIDALIHKHWELAAREYQRDYRGTAGAPAAHPDIPTPECVLTVPRYEDIRPTFERFRFEIAAALVGYSPWHVVARDLLLSWGDRTAARCLATYYPPLQVVRELRQLDPKKYARVKWAADAYAKS